jgi:hypothetical protein
LSSEKTALEAQPGPRLPPTGFAEDRQSMVPRAQLFTSLAKKRAKVLELPAPV